MCSFPHSPLTLVEADYTSDALTDSTPHSFEVLSSKFTELFSLDWIHYYTVQHSTELCWQQFCVSIFLQLTDLSPTHVIFIQVHRIVLRFVRSSLIWNFVALSYCICRVLTCIAFTEQCILTADGHTCGKRPESWSVLHWKRFCPLPVGQFVT